MKYRGIVDGILTASLGVVRQCSCSGKRCWREIAETEISTASKLSRASGEENSGRGDVETSRVKIEVTGRW